MAKRLHIESLIRSNRKKDHPLETFLEIVLENVIQRFSHAKPKKDGTRSKKLEGERKDSVKDSVEYDPSVIRMTREPIGMKAASPKRDDFIIQKVEGGIIDRLDGEIDGQAMQMENIQHARVFLLDHMAAFTIDEAYDTQMVIGPTNGSVFLRQCENCVISVACAQFRCRDCKNCVIYLYAMNEPIVETSTEMRFAPWNVAYEGQRTHFDKAGLDPTDNKWDKIFDFNKDDGTIPQPHWLIEPKNGWKPLVLGKPSSSSLVENCVPSGIHATRKERFEADHGSATSAQSKDPIAMKDIPAKTRRRPATAFEPDSPPPKKTSAKEKTPPRGTTAPSTSAQTSGRSKMLEGEFQFHASDVMMEKKAISPKKKKKSTTKKKGDRHGDRVDMGFPTRATVARHHGASIDFEVVSDAPTEEEIHDLDWGVDGSGDSTSGASFDILGGRGKPKRAGRKSDLVIEDVADFDVDDDSLDTGGSGGSKARREIGSRGGVVGMSADLDSKWVGETVDLITLSNIDRALLGTRQGLPEGWVGQSFEFETEYPFLHFGLVQYTGGPCGVLAAVQAEIIHELWFKEGDKGLFNRPLQMSSRFEDTMLRDALCNAITRILWRIKTVNNREKARVVLTAGHTSSSRLTYLKNSNIFLLSYGFSQEKTLHKFVRENLDFFTNEKGNGVVLFTISVMLTRGLQAIQTDMDTADAPLISTFGTCSHELVNLIVTGRALTNLFDGDKVVDGKRFRGIPSRCSIGLLSHFEFHGYLTVGEYLKSPSDPIWIIHAEGHYTILFATKRIDTSRQFDLYYYNGLGRQDEVIRLTLFPGEREESDGFDDDDLASPIEQVMWSKWASSRIDWNGSDRLL
eukprot:TRINITY_DN15627_c0_g1_i1.p2 TRINITY_DN15627_c0_g1~~TRINITY_DN15627_c0_g1_i1.p2  ORF type:complete len:940 (-),score=264.97 TRINITY_DN15627_c0_g1_i1:3054-5615(-)